jgi:hypothetical protein
MHPKLVKYAISPLHEAFFGRNTFSYLKKLAQLQWVSPETLAQTRFEKLKGC